MRFFLYLDEPDAEAVGAMEQAAQAVRGAGHGVHLLLHGRATRAEVDLSADCVSRTYGNKPKAPAVADVLKVINRKIASALFEGYAPDVVIAWHGLGVIASPLARSQSRRDLVT